MAQPSADSTAVGSTLGFKQLTLANWTEPDPVNRHFARISPLVGAVQMGESDWAREFLAVELTETVPVQIRDLFAIARGAMLYGWFFYPLFRLGEEQLFRVLESAARLRYCEVGGGRTSPRYEEAVEYLGERGVIASHQLERWHAARQLRNMSSHPERATVVPPGMAARMLRTTATDIDVLFATPAV